MGGSRVISLRTAEKTHSFGCHVGSCLPPNSILALSGELGTGKTCFIQGVALALGITTPVQSPTFAYLNIYDEGKLPLYHFDLYRMKGLMDFFAMGFEEYFEKQGISAIEWSERIEAALPKSTVRFRFFYEGAGRVVHLSSFLNQNLIDSLAWD